MQQRNHLLPNSNSDQGGGIDHAAIELANSPPIMKRPDVREHTMDAVWDNGTLWRPSAFAKACTRHQLV
jgi:hypothetical protein